MKPWTGRHAVTPERVLQLLDALEPLVVWVDGGWGVDALVGR